MEVNPLDSVETYDDKLASDCRSAQLNLLVAITVAGLLNWGIHPDALTRLLS